MKKKKQPPPYSTYYCFTPDHDLQAALKIYARRFGAQPEEHFVEKRALWLGPIPDPIRQNAVKKLREKRA